jgi:FAD dependent oxidoreductase TIGR03364
MCSRSIWLEVLAKSGAWHEKAGSLHVARAEDEALVLREFHEESRQSGFECELLAPSRVPALSPYVRRDGLCLALWSPNEVSVDPRATSTALIDMLRDVMDVCFELDTQITACAPPSISAGSRTWEVDRVWMCTGDELQALFSDQLKTLGLVPCKLQMMRTEPILDRLGPMLAAGLTLRHYLAFRKCRTLAALDQRLAVAYPEHIRHGIHVMVAQTGLGELTIGDSHHYGNDIEPFDDASIDDLILDYLAEFLDVGPFRVRSRWHGIYVKHPSQPYAVLSPAPNVTAVVGLGGHGMTLSFGLAEELVRRTLGEPLADIRARRA